MSSSCCIDTINEVNTDIDNHYNLNDIDFNAYNDFNADDFNADDYNNDDYNNDDDNAYDDNSHLFACDNNGNPYNTEYGINAVNGCSYTYNTSTP